MSDQTTTKIETWKSTAQAINAADSDNPHEYGGAFDETRSDIIGMGLDDNPPYLVGRGFRRGAFSGASDRCKWELLLLLSQISEASYRRGIRQALAIQKSEPAALTEERAEELRYADAHVSPCLISNEAVPAISMLKWQFGNHLVRLGLDHPSF